jgi:predicted AAA+ superfamily ATPase
MPVTTPVPRLLDLEHLLDQKSHFLLGPRQTGKSFLIRQTLRDAKVYDLLDNSVYLAFSRDPSRLSQEVTEQDTVVVIDEVQRLPQILNEVHRLIETRGVRFLLTGSSARKLRGAGVNLLGGRARTKHLHPLVSAELGDQFDLDHALSRGLLPSIYFSDDPEADLEAYAGNYLQQEIVAEGVVRSAPSFSRFLTVAALCNASIVNFTNVANDAQVARTTVYEYFEILKDTLILHEVPAWKESKKRKPLTSSKYYFFDTGVVRWLQGRRTRQGTPEFGEAMETLLHHELAAYRDYRGSDPLCHWRSSSGYEVDFIVGDHTAIEIKAKPTIAPQDLRSLRALAEEERFERLLCVSMEPRRRVVDGIEILPWQEFLALLWQDAYRGS